MGKKKVRNKIERATTLDVFNIIILFILSAVMLLPIVYIFSTALKPLSELNLYPPRFFVRRPSMDNFRDLLFAVKLSVVPFARYILNSFVVTIAVIGLTVTMSAMSAYALSKIRFPGSAAIMAIIIISLMFTPEAMSITRYLIVSRIGINNTYFGHIMPYLALPVGVFLLKQFIDQLPNELLEAARIDGASDWGIFVKIAVPNVKPAIGTAAILAFQSVWNNTETSILYMTRESMKTLPYFIQTMTAGVTNVITRQGASASAALIMLLPNLIIFLILQRSMMTTMVNSGIK